MRIRKILPSVLLLLLAAAVAAGLWLTRQDAPGARSLRQPKARERLVDLSPIQTAKRMALLVSTREEEPFARDAVRLADHEVDLAFADAIRRAVRTVPPQTPEVKSLLAEKDKYLDGIQDGQRTLQRLTKALEGAREQDKDALSDQLDVAKAQLELDKDELDAVNESLGKLGADPAARIGRLKTAFAATENAPAMEGVQAGARFVPGSLLNLADIWLNLRTKLALLLQARDEAQAKGDRIGKRHDAKAAELAKRKEDLDAARARAKGFSRAGSAQVTREGAKATLQDLKTYMDDQKDLADMGKRWQNERDLVDVYNGWRDLVLVQERAALHAVLIKLAWILVVVVLVYFAGQIFEAVFRAMVAGRKRVSRNIRIVKFSAEVLGVLAIVLIVLGTPGQLTTLLGLAGAGLTVALKDFIISFFGWFVLVGPKGIHVGDWVEIKGVSGEVVEIGMLRTLLLETGNWSDAGHPTGRVVSFVNSFAMEGHFFNFSSSGQWMWDELTLTAPPGQDPEPLIDGIRALVDDRTRENTAKAFKEWEHSERGYRVAGLKAEPGINVQPTPAGVEIRVRYITSAQERNELRRELNQAVVAMLHGKKD